MNSKCLRQDLRVGAMHKYNKNKAIMLICTLIEKKLQYTEVKFNSFSSEGFTTVSKGGLISEFFSLWLQFQKKGARSLPSALYI